MSTPEYKFDQGDIVAFKQDGKDIYGYVRGVALTPVPGLGATFIVELDERIEGYPYTHIAVPESMLTKQALFAHVLPMR